jgi:hypothetical protein
MSDEHDSQICERENLIADAISAAEANFDPLEGLAERTAVDPGAPFMPEVLERLTALRKEDLAAFETLRAQLKKAACRMAALDEAIAEEGGDSTGCRPNQADFLIELAQAAELFHTADGTGFADLDVNGHRQTLAIRGKGFRRWLARRFFQETGGAPCSEALQSALNVIEAKAHFDGPERVVHIRVGGLDERLYLDLGDKKWRAVEIDATGWRVINNPPVRFRGAAGMKPLPMPVGGRSKPCAHFSTSNQTRISCWWWRGRWRAFAIVGPGGCGHRKTGQRCGAEASQADHQEVRPAAQRRDRRALLLFSSDEGAGCRRSARGR